MLFILHRYIFREIFRVFLLASIALTAILSLGMILRPVQEYGVSPGQVFALIGYILPITLTFVLPMASLFATTLVYGRFGSDNELDACKASGIGIKTLVYPGLALAVIVAIANLVLSFYITPSFVKRAERSIRANVKKIIFRNIQRKGYYLSPEKDWYVYADYANEKDGVLSGVIIAEISGTGISRTITCDDAYVQFETEAGFNDVSIRLKNTYLMDSQGVFWNELGEFRKEMDNVLSDNIKFKKVDDLKQIRTNFMHFAPIAKLGFSTYSQFTTELIAQDINKIIKSDKEEFCRLISGEKNIQFKADTCTISDKNKIKLKGNVVVNEYDNGEEKPSKIYYCTEALLNVEGQRDLLNISMVLYSPQWESIEEEKKGSAATGVIIRGLQIPYSVTLVTDKFGRENFLENVSPQAIAGAIDVQPGSQLGKFQIQLAGKLKKTASQITSEIHSRLAFGIGCIPLILIGIGLGIALKGGHLLTAFGFSAIPAVILLLCMFSGKNNVENPDSSIQLGLTLIWAGPVILTMITAVIYQRLLKN